MKRLLFLVAPLLFFSCKNKTADGLYLGPAVQGQCATEVFPPFTLLAPALNKQKPDVPKSDPLVRQEGLMVCRSF